MPDNRLADETSPYLLQHADNPVAWRAWGPDALTEAKEGNKPILLSVGYAACHWCHVMAHESFEDPDVAEVMNRLFVNIKVDREERPDLDAIYQTALALMGQHGGWPLTMFLTPDGEPFWGGTYFPKEPKYGRPGFVQVLEKLSDVFHGQKDAVEENRSALMTHLATYTGPMGEGELGPELLDQVAGKLTDHLDPANGGIGGAPKFPQASILALLWRAWLRGGGEPCKTAVTLTLDRMAQGGIYDHLGGGFARYSVDERWLVPHFEKMLYDNAQLVELYARVWQDTRSPLYAERVAGTMEWVRREMTVEGGGFASSLDADSEGEEGRFYVWTAEDLQRHLPPEDFQLFADVYGLEPGGNWEGKTILNRLHAVGRLDDESEARLARCRDTLFRLREDRVRPGLDDKVLADWTGMMAAAATFAGFVFDRADWIDMAKGAYDFVRETMTAPDGRLRHATRAGRVQPVSLLSDHAQMMRAALALFEATGDRVYLDHIAGWTDILEARFAHPEGGFYTAPDDADDLIIRSRTAQDNAEPSANGVLVEVFARMHHLSGDDAWRRRAESILDAFAGDCLRNFFSHAALLNGYDTLLNAVTATLLGARNDKALTPFVDAWRAVSLPGGVLRVVESTDSLAPDDPARPAASELTPPAALVCAGQTCSLPLKDANAFEAELRARRGSAR